MLPSVDSLLMLSGAATSVSVDLDSPKLDINVSAMVHKLVDFVIDALINLTLTLSNGLPLVNAKLDTLKSMANVSEMEDKLEMMIPTNVVLVPILTLLSECVSHVLKVVSAVKTATLAMSADLNSTMILDLTSVSNSAVMERNILLLVMMETMLMVMDALEIARSNLDTSVLVDHLHPLTIVMFSDQIE